jgi:hypothetical protein
MPLYPANLPPEAVRDFSTLQIYRRRPTESSKRYLITAADGVMAMALGLRCQAW